MASGWTHCSVLLSLWSSVESLELELQGPAAGVKKVTAVPWLEGEELSPVWCELPSVSFSAQAPLLEVQKLRLYHKLCFMQAVNKITLLIFSWVCSDWISRADDTCIILVWYFTTICLSMYIFVSLYKIVWYSANATSQNQMIFHWKILVYLYPV